MPKEKKDKPGTWDFSEKEIKQVEADLQGLHDQQIVRTLTPLVKRFPTKLATSKPK